MQFKLNILNILWMILCHVVSMLDSTGLNDAFNVCNHVLPWTQPSAFHWRAVSNLQIDANWWLQVVNSLKPHLHVAKWHSRTFWDFLKPAFAGWAMQKMRQSETFTDPCSVENKNRQKVSSSILHKFMPRCGSSSDSQIPVVLAMVMVLVPGIWGGGGKSSIRSTLELINQDNDSQSNTLLSWDLIMRLSSVVKQQ